MVKKMIKKETIMTIIKLIVTAFVFAFVVETFGKWGLIGFIGCIILFACYKLWVKRDVFMHTIRVTEASIWGKPLDRDLWKKGEMKNHKVKIVWRKKDLGGKRK